MGGSLIQDKRDGKWCISVYWEGKRYRIYKNPFSGDPFYTKKVAEKWLSKIRTEIDECTFNPKAWLPDSPLSTRVYCREWLKNLTVCPNTARVYRVAVNKHIIPFFGDKDIRKIKYGDIEDFINWIPLESKGVYNVVNTLKTILRYAYRREDISRVPPFPKLSYDLPDIEYLTIEQQEKLLDAIPDVTGLYFSS